MMLARPESPPDPAVARPHGLGRLRRSAQLTRFVLRHWALVSSAADAHSRDFRRVSADEFVRDLQALGPAFVKIGQTLSTRPDLLPAGHRIALERLQDRAATVPFEQIRRTVEDELGVRLSKAFATFDEHPLAAASLAQVHAATLRDGSEVAVKVQRPGIAAAIDADLDMLGHLAAMADRWTEQGRRVRFAQWVNEMRETLGEELDYHLEAENLHVFAHNLAAYPMIVVPVVHADLSSARVLTMARIHGAKVSQAIELRRIEEPLGERAAELIRAYLDQIFINGLVHADPHPGNVFLDTEGRIALIDLGMVARLSPKSRTALLKILCAAVQGDGDQVAEVAASIGERLEMYDASSWRRRCGRLVGRYATQGDCSVLSEGDLMVELTRIGAESGLRPPPEIALLGKTLLNLDAVCRLLDPHVPVRAIFREHTSTLIRDRTFGALRPAAMAATSVDLMELLHDVPGQTHDILENIARNRIRIRVSGLEESRLLENLQKIANRIAGGIISAALIIGAALALRIDGGSRLLGYPALALVLFVGAFCLGCALVLSALLTDRRVSRYRARKQ